MAIAFSQSDPETWVPERRGVIRVPVRAVAAYRAVGMQGYELCEVLDVSTRGMQVVLDRRLADGAVVTIAVQQADHDRPRRLHAHVLRSIRDRGEWRHVVVAASRQLWPPMIIVDLACSTPESHQARRLQDWLHE